MINSRPVAKWCARITGFVTSAIFSGYLIVGEINKDYEEVESVFYLFIVFMLLTIVGYARAWYKPIEGATIMIVGGSLMMIFHFSQDDRFTAMVYGIPFIIEGCLFLLSQEGVKNTIILDAEVTVIIKKES